MIDMSGVILAKSDQINAADLVGKTMTVKIAGVKLTGAEQATEIRLVGEDKVWRPNKNTVRIMARAWGNDGEKWIGRSATLYCDPKVKYGKDTPGGIRISHLSELRDKMTVCLQERKGTLKTYEIEPLQVQTPAADDFPEDTRPQAEAYIAKYVAAVAKVPVRDAMPGFTARHKDAIAAIRADHPDLADTADAALTARLAGWEDPE